MSFRIFALLYLS